MSSWSLPPLASSSFHAALHVHFNVDDLSKCWEGHSGRAVIPLAPRQEGGAMMLGPALHRSMVLLTAKGARDGDYMGSLCPSLCI